MPYAHITLATDAVSDTICAALQAETTRLLADLLGKEAALTVVSISTLPPTQWSLAGRPLLSGQSAAHLEVSITAGTNTEAEKAAFLAAAHAMLRQHSGGLATPTYVTLRDTPAADWGYDGRSQQQRKQEREQAGNPANPITPTNSPRTLRQWAGLAPLTSIAAERTALLVIDAQNEYAASGQVPIHGLTAAVRQIGTLVAAADRLGMLVVHIHHVAGSPQAAVFRPGSSGIEPLPELRPAATHVRVEKHHTSSFHATELENLLRQRGIDTLILTGFGTHMCVDTAARAATHLQFRVLVAADACASRDLPGHDGTLVRAADIHRATLAALGDRFAEVADTASIVARLGLAGDQAGGK